MEKKVSEKSLDKMKLNELYELKHIVMEYSEENVRCASSYCTNGMIDRMVKLSPEEQIFVENKIKADNLISKINKLIEEKIIKYYD